MTRQEAIDAYTERFGGFPYFLFMGADDADVIYEVRRALANDREIEAPLADADY